MKYFIETYGCQMNVHDSERMAGLLEASGYDRAADEGEADVVVINTCSVREKAEDKLYARLADLKGRARVAAERPVVVVAGCVAQQEGARLVERSGLVDAVVGTQRVRQLPMLVERGRAHRGTDDGSALSAVVDVETPYDDPSFPLGLTRHSDPVKAYVTIIEGCNDYCAFCVVPYTRGHERMRSKAEIVAEVEAAVASGRPEVQLLGQIVNHYQAPDDPGCDFPALLEAVDRVPGVRRIRFASPHPRHVSVRLIEAVRDLPAVCKHLHLPVQSGSTAVLRRMRRRHTREEYLALVARVREAIPNVQLSTDTIVGFPGETEEEFGDTLSLTEAVRFHSMFSFKYSERPNTLASRRFPDDVPEAAKARRIRELQLLQRRIQLELHTRAVGNIVEVLVDARSRRRDWEFSGRTSGNTVVNFPGQADWVGRLVDVQVRRAGPHSVWGEVVSGGAGVRPRA
ncbi:MAG: tRNA (N6-isopentenyl adenosine(37)-C2)-methylthiotransferase MiaB [Acidobacteriota bacterium]